MEMARGFEAAKAVTDIVGTPEEAQFAVENANRLVTLQANWMLGADDPEAQNAAWDQVVEMFESRDDQGKPINGPDGKHQLDPDFKPFVHKAASTAIQDFTSAADGQIAALQAKLQGSYPTEEARAADADALQNAQYEKAAFDFVMSKLIQPSGGSTALPALPPDATPQQIAFQKQLEDQQKDLDAKMGKQGAQSRKAANQAINNEVQQHYETGINQAIESHIAAMKERGEYLPEFILSDKWINPQTNQPTKVSDFGARVYLALNAKINGNPLHAAKLRSLEALGARGKEARKAEVTRLTNLYLPKIIEGRVQEIQDGIRASSSKPSATPLGKVARMEPQSQNARCEYNGCQPDTLMGGSGSCQRSRLRFDGRPNSRAVDYHARREEKVWWISSGSCANVEQVGQIHLVYLIDLYISSQPRSESRARNRKQGKNYQSKVAAEKQRRVLCPERITRPRKASSR
jgi:hypothetical protein